ncbi:MAG: ATP-binding protein, partial [Christensenellales bacterium]
MLFVLIGLLLVASVFVLLMKKNRESLYLLGMCCSLMVQFSGILIFIAKKGGYSKSIIGFLFFSQTLRNKLQYLFITLDTLGYVIAVGRYLFPLFLMEIALQYSMIAWVR